MRSIPLPVSAAAALFRDLAWLATHKNIRRPLVVTEGLKSKRNKLHWLLQN